MKYEIQLRVQQCEVDYDANRAGVLAELVLMRDGEQVSQARDALTYECERLDGGEISKEDLVYDIEAGKLEDRYKVDFSLLEQDELTRQLQDNAQEAIPVESIDAAFDAFFEASDEYLEFGELFPQGPFVR